MGSVRKRYGWQHWVYKRPTSPSSRAVSVAGDAGLTEASDDAADTAVESGSPPLPRGSPEPLPPSTTWRDAATKQLPSSAPRLSTNSAPPNPPTSSTPRTSATSAPLLPPPAQATAPTAGPHNAMGSLPSRAHSASGSVGRGLSPLEIEARSHSPRASGGGQSEGWETSKGKDRRHRAKTGLVERVAVTHLSSADSSLCSGKVQLADEQHSDKTTLMAEEDWVSTGTEEQLLLAASAAAPSIPSPNASTTHAATPWPSNPHPPISGKIVRPSAPHTRKRVTRKSELAKGVEKPRSCGIKELNDAPRMSQPPAGVLAFASRELALLARHGSSLACATKAASSRFLTSLSASTPRTQAALRPHVYSTWLHACLLPLLLLLLCALELCPLPPSLISLTSSRWVEMPIGLVLAFKFNELGTAFLAGFQPSGTRVV